MSKNFILALGSLIGTIVGAGVFGLPYVIAKGGALTGIGYFLILTPALLLIYLIYGEVVLRTKEKHRLVGYVKKYLGDKAKIIVTISVIVGTVAAILAYIILGGQFLNILIPSISAYAFSIVLWAVLFFFIFLGIDSIAPLEVILNIGLLIALVVIFGFSIPKIELGNFVLVNKSFLYLPFGVVLASLLGWSAIPEISPLLSKKKNLKKVIISALGISVFFYILFSFSVAGVTGGETTQEPFASLLPHLGREIIFLGGIFGFLAVSTSLLINGNYLKNTLILDYKIPYLGAFLITALLPITLFLLGFREFITVISVGGIVIALVQGVAIILSFYKSKKYGDKLPAYKVKLSKPIAGIIILLLVLGTVFSIL